MSSKCSVCETTIYPNDPQICLDGTNYHKPCAKCADCGCQITLNNFTKSGTTLLCKTHYFKRFHEEGSYLGGEKYTRMSSRDAVKPPSESDGTEIATAPVTSAAVSIPVSTATRRESFTFTTSATSGHANPVEEVKYSESTQSLRSKFEKTSESSGSDIQNSSRVGKRKPSFTSTNPKCVVCTKTIYANDPQITLDSIKYHTPCAKCADCFCQITISNFTKNGTTLLCKTHYFTRFSTSGSYLGGDKYERKSDREARGAGGAGSVDDGPDFTEDLSVPEQVMVIEVETSVVSMTIDDSLLSKEDIDKLNKNEANPNGVTQHNLSPEAHTESVVQDVSQSQQLGHEQLPIPHSDYLPPVPPLSDDSLA